MGPFTAEALAAWSGASDSAPACKKCGMRVHDVPAGLGVYYCGVDCLPGAKVQHGDVTHLVPQWKRGMR